MSTRFRLRHETREKPDANAWRLTIVSAIVCQVRINQQAVALRASTDLVSATFATNRYACGIPVKAASEAWQSQPYESVKPHDEKAYQRTRSNLQTPIYPAPDGGGFAREPWPTTEV